MHSPIILASSSQARLDLLTQINIKPNKIIPANIDEVHLSNELPKDLASRLSIQKAEKVAKVIDNGYIIAADTVAAIGRRILPKALSDKEVKYCLNMISGRRHKVYSSVNVIKVQDNKIILSRHKLVTSIIKFKRLSDNEIKIYIQSQEGINKAGGYSIQGLAQCFINFISGSYSNIVGLPLFETRNILLSLGYNLLR